MQKIAAVRNAEPALRYGRFYFRPVSGDGFNFGVSTLPNGIFALSRILNDEEVIIVANTNTTTTIPVYVIVEPALNAVGQTLRVLYTNKKGSTAPAAIQSIAQASVTEVDGSHGNGPLNVTRVTLLPMEVQILRIYERLPRFAINDTRIVRIGANFLMGREATCVCSRAPTCLRSSFVPQGQSRK